MKLKAKMPRIQRLRHDWQWVKEAKEPLKGSLSPAVDQRIQEIMNGLTEDEDSDVEFKKKKIPRKKLNFNINMKPPKDLNVSSTKYRSPWYIPVKNWNVLSKSPVYERGYDTQRAENIYYHLRKPTQDPNPLRRRTVSDVEKADEHMKNKLRNLSYLNRYKEYLQTHKLRLPGFLKELD